MFSHTAAHSKQFTFNGEVGSVKSTTFDRSILPGKEKKLTRRKINISHKTKSTEINHAPSFVISGHLICMSTVSNYTATVFVIYDGEMSRSRGGASCARAQWTFIDFRPNGEVARCDSPKLDYNTKRCRRRKAYRGNDLPHEIIVFIRQKLIRASIIDLFRIDSDRNRSVIP